MNKITSSSIFINYGLLMRLIRCFMYLIEWYRPKTNRTTYRPN